VQPDGSLLPLHITPESELSEESGHDLTQVASLAVLLSLDPRGQKQPDTHCSVHMVVDTPQVAGHADPHWLITFPLVHFGLL